MSGTTPLEPYRVCLRYNQVSANLLIPGFVSELSKFTETELALMHFLSGLSLDLFCDCKDTNFFWISEKKNSGGEGKRAAFVEDSP